MHPLGLLIVLFNSIAHAVLYWKKLIPFYQRISRIFLKIWFSRSCLPSWVTKHIFWKFYLLTDTFCSPQTIGWVLGYTIANPINGNLQRAMFGATGPPDPLFCCLTAPLKLPAPKEEKRFEWLPYNHISIIKWNRMNGCLIFCFVCHKRINNHFLNICISKPFGINSL